MRKITIAILTLLVAVLSATAQETEAEKIQEIRDKGIKTRMAYADYKDLYNAKEYIHMSGDPYTPIGAGLASFIIPGLGQILNEQTGKGIGMLFGNVLLVTGGVTIGLCCADVKKDEKGKVIERTTKPVGNVCAALCLAGALAIDIWSICDAVHVAKIKNMYFRDCVLLSSSLDVKLVPSLAWANTSQGIEPAPGMTLAIRF